MPAHCKTGNSTASGRINNYHLTIGDDVKKNITWLHISDIHFCPNKEWRDNCSRTSLLEHLARTFTDNDHLYPDLIFCTGDIAFGEASQMPLRDQYTKAMEFFDELLKVCGRDGTALPKDRLFVVPGNHDVNRTIINNDAQRSLNSMAESATANVAAINQRFNDRSIEFKEAAKRLDEYAEFIKKYLPHLQDTEGRHFYTKVVNIHGVNVGVAGLNSAWSCSGPEDDRNIWLAAAWQFNSAKKSLTEATFRIGLMHHPVDWLNIADRDITARRISSDFDFWLHGHSHKAWVTPIQSHIEVAAGAIGADCSDEFGINITTIDLNSGRGVSHLHNKKAEASGWTISPVDYHAPNGQWPFDLPVRLQSIGSKVDNLPQNALQHTPQQCRDEQISSTAVPDFIERYLSQRLSESLRSLPSQPQVWISPILKRKPETARDSAEEERINIADLIGKPRHLFIKAPPQYGLTCLAHFMIREAWKNFNKSVWIYLDATSLKPHAASINEAIGNELSVIGVSTDDICCIVLDSWQQSNKDASKLLKKIAELYPDIPVICMQLLEKGLSVTTGNDEVLRLFEHIYLWALPREEIRKIVSCYNETKQIGDEDAITNRLVSDLEVLNLHRTPLNCLTLLKVSELDFEESPVNRSEMINRVLFLLFNSQETPTYKLKPDLKDCEYVLGYFCEILVREGNYTFSRDRFLMEVQKFCKANLIDLEIHLVFDILYKNNLIIKSGNFFHFRFSYWIFYFVAQRMHHDKDFATYIFDNMRYAQYPEIIEFYTGIDRMREDALQVIIRDLQACIATVKEKCGLPEDLNPFRFAKWDTTPEIQEKMRQEIADGVLESNLPSDIKDQFADRFYDPVRPYDQSVAEIITDYSVGALLNLTSAAARALRNSDYVTPEIKRTLLTEIMKCWNELSKALLIVTPKLAQEGHATYDGAGFQLASDFGDTPQKRAMRIIGEIPYNITTWFQDDLYSQKMGPLLFDQLCNNNISDLSKHELILLLILQRPRDWHKHVEQYIADNAKNSFYLFDVSTLLRMEHRYSFVSKQTLKEMDNLIRMASIKHLTGVKAPGKKMIENPKYAKFGPTVRDV